MMLAWHIRDVFRQARATGLTAALIALTTVATLAATTAAYADGRLTTFFGVITLQEVASHDAAVPFLRSVIAGFAADTVGVLLALVWTAGFLPAFVDPAAVSVLLAKPAGRNRLFFGKSFAVFAYVGVYAVGVVALTWLGLGVSTGEWPAGYWLGVPLLLAHFAAFFGCGALIAVATRSAAASVVGTLLIWAMCFGTNYARHVLATQSVPGMSPVVGKATEFVYWLLPKPVDFGLIFAHALDGRVELPLVNYATLTADGRFAPIASVASSLAFGLAILALAAFEFSQEDY